MSEDFERLIAASSSCDLDEDYSYVNVNPSVDVGSDDPQDLDPEFKASSLLMAMNSCDDIQATPETCLLINKTLQEVVNDLLKIIAKEIQGIEISKFHVVPPSAGPKVIGDIFALDNGLGTDNTVDFSAIPNRSQPNRLPQKAIRVPFFESRDLSKPPLNQEAALRRQRNEVNLTDFVPLNWRKADNRRLVRAVAVDCRQRRIENVKRELKRKEDEYNEWLIVGPKSKALKREKDELTYKVAQLQASSDEVFLNCAMSEEEVDQIDWMKISAVDFNGAISDRNLRLIWMNQFNKANNYGAWSKKEDEALIEAIDQFGLHAWEKVATAIGTRRTPFMCIQRYQQRLAPRQMTSEKNCVDLDNEPSPQKPWTTDEDNRLLELVRMATDEQGVIHWTFVNSRVSAHSIEDCRSRWAEISPNIQSGPFTEREDLQLLLGVQRYGAENFDLVAAKCLSHRDARDCRKRYMQLTCDLASEWTYEEDRKLFLLMEKVEDTYRKRINAKPSQTIHVPQRCYKDLLIHLPGRTWQTIRNRHRLLKSWNIVYLNLRKKVCRPQDYEDESDNDDISVDDLRPGNNRWTREEVRAVFLRTPFMLNLLEKLHSAGARSAEFIRDIFSTELPTKAEALETGRPLTIDLEIDPILRDAAEGIIVPRPLPRERWMHILRHTDIRMLLENRVRKFFEEEIEEYLQKKGVIDIAAAMSNSAVFLSKRSQALRTLLEDEDHFLLAVEQSLRHPTIAGRLEGHRSVNDHLNLVPEIAKRCITNTCNLLSGRIDCTQPQTSKDQDQQIDEEQEPSTTQEEPKASTSNAHNSTPAEDPDSDEERTLVRHEIQKRIKESLEHRASKTNDLLVMHKLKRCFEIFSFYRRLKRVRQLMRWKKTPMEEVQSCDPDSRFKVSQLLTSALHGGDRALERNHLKDIKNRGRTKLHTLPPNCTTLNAFRLLLHQRPQLLSRGYFHLEAFFRTHLELTEAENREKSKDEMLAFSRVDQNENKSKRMFEKMIYTHMLDDHRKILRDPRYLLLKARLFALFLWPSVLAAGNVEDYYNALKSSIDFSRQKMIEARRARRRERIKNSRKEKFFEKMRQRIAKRYVDAGMDFNTWEKVRRHTAYWKAKRKKGHERQDRAERQQNYYLRSFSVHQPDLVRLNMTEKKSLVMPFAALELIRNGYQIDSYFPIGDDAAVASEQNSKSFSPIRSVKQELMDE